ncbi:hypothetical protein A3Q37_07008 [Streptomyces sp. PTY087I2]|nr:hypothetical protein A3Q37_07008 [Streptomyces sp. PTY087I2]
MTSPRRSVRVAWSGSSKRMRRNSWPDHSPSPSGSWESRWAERRVVSADSTSPRSRSTIESRLRSSWTSSSVRTRSRGAKASAHLRACSGRAEAGSSRICWRAGVRTCSYRVELACRTRMSLASLTALSAAERSALQPRRERRDSAADCRASSRLPGYGSGSSVPSSAPWSRRRSRRRAAVSSKPPAESSAVRWAWSSSLWAARAVSRVAVASASSALAVRRRAWALSASAGTRSSGSSVWWGRSSSGASRSASPRSRPRCSLAVEARVSRSWTCASARAAAAWRDGPSAPSVPSRSWPARVRTLLVSRSSSARAALSSLSARACSARRSAPTPTFSYSWDAAR